MRKASARFLNNLFMVQLEVDSKNAQILKKQLIIY